MGWCTIEEILKDENLELIVGFIAFSQVFIKKSFGVLDSSVELREGSRVLYFYGV